MTPNDVVRLLPVLAEPNDQTETQWSLQTRPNVLLEAGLALALQPKSTILVNFGAIHRVSDLAGLNYIHVDASRESHEKFLDRTGKSRNGEISGEFLSPSNRPPTPGLAP